MIKAHCTTNLDAYINEIWPNVFIAVPRIGDYIQSKHRSILEVYQITHCYDEDEPFITIYLR